MAGGITSLFRGASLWTLLIVGLIGWWVSERGRGLYERIVSLPLPDSQEKQQRAIEQFGTGTPASREPAILEAFDSSDHIFRMVAENRDKAYRMRFTLLRNLQTFNRRDLESMRFAYVAYNRGLLDEEKFYTYRITAMYQGGQTNAIDPEYMGLFGFWRARKKQGEVDRIRGAVEGFAAARTAFRICTT